MNTFRLICLLLLAACAGNQDYDPLSDYDELGAKTILDAPSPQTGRFAPAERDLVYRGEYLVEVLGCGVCHTDGALSGAPDAQLSLAGSRTGIAYSNPLGDEFPGIAYPPNITPDSATGIGDWSKQQIGNAIRAGIGRHGDRPIATMPWQGYMRLSDDDLEAIVTYLLSIAPVSHAVPAEVRPGERATDDFVYFGVYRSRF